MHGSIAEIPRRSNLQRPRSWPKKMTPHRLCSATSPSSPSRSRPSQRSATSPAVRFTRNRQFTRRSLDGFGGAGGHAVGSCNAAASPSVRMAHAQREWHPSTTRPLITRDIVPITKDIYGRCGAPFRIYHQGRDVVDLNDLRDCSSRAEGPGQISRSVCRAGRMRLEMLLEVSAGED
jgi:hypothetical protein